MYMRDTACQAAAWLKRPNDQVERRAAPTLAKLKG
jgi:hypothetical protein